MPPRTDIVRRYPGWLAIPASLPLLFCVISAMAVMPQSAAVPGNDIDTEKFIDGSPFQKIFSQQADFVVLTFFDLYCVACQQSAENFNVLYESLPDALPGKITRMTGIGIGDTEFELSVFQRKYKLQYPSLPDPDKSFEIPFAVRGTPTVLVFMRNNSDCVEIYRHEGRFRSDDVNSLVKDLNSRIVEK